MRNLPAIIVTTGTNLTRRTQKKKREGGEGGSPNLGIYVLKIKVSNSRHESNPTTTTDQYTWRKYIDVYV